jgi:Na+/melibiose symporter-like transporter
MDIVVDITNILIGLYFSAILPSNTLFSALPFFICIKMAISGINIPIIVKRTRKKYILRILDILGAK